ncbi:hypothetical protein SAMN05216275_1695 [Streptosporangium canum]|uniref:Uncharacterized protein n=1 Tax=Streptosporangium canum TaxID=324952 RepID=A0A1I4FQJ2_9ACTN|nr:hypothetical protein SAMN05216275_1695 [Streptosporangium canum]
MRPVQVEHPGRVEPVQGYAWGKVGWVTEQLWRSFPVVAEKRTVWVFCEFGNQSSIITMVPREGMVMIRRLPL